MFVKRRNLSSAKRTARVELLTPWVISCPKSLSSIVKSLISIPDKRTAAIVSGSSSLVTSSSFSRDSAALLKARSVGIAEQKSQVAEIAVAQAMKLRTRMCRWVSFHSDTDGSEAGADPTEERKVVEETAEGLNNDELLELVEKEARHQLCDSRQRKLEGWKVTALPVNCWP